MEGHCVTTVTAPPFLDFASGTPYTCPRFKLSVRWPATSAARGRVDRMVVGAPGNCLGRVCCRPLPSTQLAYHRDNPGGTVAPEDTVCQAGRSLDF